MKGYVNLESVQGETIDGRVIGGVNDKHKGACKIVVARVYPIGVFCASSWILDMDCGDIGNCERSAEECAKDDDFHGEKMNK